MVNGTADLQGSSIQTVRWRAERGINAASPNKELAKEFLENYR